MCAKGLHTHVVLPLWLQEKLLERARAEGVDVNTLIVRAVSVDLGLDQNRQGISDEKQPRPSRRRG